MKEPVRRTQHPYLVGAVVAVVAVGYFALMFGAGPRDQSQALNYDTDIYEFVEMEDDVEIDFEETARIVADYPGVRAMALDDDGRIYIAAQDLVAVYDGEGNKETEFAVEGKPVSICVAPDGMVYLGMDEVDGARAYIVALREDGNSEVLYTLEERSYPTSIVADAESIFVANMAKRVVLHLDRQGNLVNEIGKKDKERDVLGLVAPSPYMDLSLDSDGTLWVVNPGRLGLESYRKNGDLITSWYRPSMKLDGFSGCCNPTHIAFTPEGKLITAEKGLVRLKIYDAHMGGAFEELVAGKDMFPAEQSVHDLAVDADNRILVLDPRHNAVRIFERTEESHERTAKSN